MDLYSFTLRGNSDFEFEVCLHLVMTILQYVAHVMNFKLVTTSITIREEPNVPEIVNVQIIDLSTSVFQRPGAQGLK